MTGWIEIDIVRQVKRVFDIPIVLDNDANAATLAEKWIGAAKASDSFLYMTISTGIGMGVYMDGRLLTGFRGNAGDIGHVVIDPAYGPCPCGQVGCFEWIASGPAIARQASQLLERPVTTKEAFALYDQRHPAVSSLIDEIFIKIGVVCVTLINLFDPELIVIGGGVSQAGKPLFSAVQSYAGKYALNLTGRRTKIVPSALHEHLLTCRYFSVEKVEMKKGDFRFRTAKPGNPDILVMAGGEGALSYGHDSNARLPLGQGEAVLVPASLAVYSVGTSGGLRLLRVYY